MGLLIRPSGRITQRRYKYRTVEIYYGSYTSFSNFRSWVAKRLGYVKWGMPSWFGTQADQQELDAIQKNKVHRAFFFHSDCEGQWTVAQCREIAKMLQSVVETVQNDPGSNDDEDVTNWEVEAAKEMIEGLRFCARTKRRAIFM